MHIVAYAELNGSVVIDYPVYQGDIQNAYPDTSFPSPFVPPKGYVPVYETQQPSYDWITQGYREVTPTEDSLGNWMRTYEVYDLEPEQAAANLAAKNEQIQKLIVDQTQARLDDFAKTRLYDGILSLATYATSTNLKFQAEGQYGVESRDATWAKLYEMLAEVEAGTRPMPAGFEDIEPELPVLTWPIAQ